MATVIGVRFKKAGKVYYFDPDGIWPRPGDYVIVETARGVEFGEVVTGARSVNDAQIVTPLKKVIRVASEEDIRRAENNEKREKEAFQDLPGAHRQAQAGHEAGQRGIHLRQQQDHLLLHRQRAAWTSATW